jgi:hypothetical protein
MLLQVLEEVPELGEDRVDYMKYKGSGTLRFHLVHEQRMPSVPVRSVRTRFVIRRRG